jgi:hypothetical protein
MMSQTGEDTPYQANLRVTVSAKCFIVRHGYCTIVSGAICEVQALNADHGIPGNEEPGVMLPGHCFTIEVGKSRGLILWR